MKVVIAAASARHIECARACLKGLGDGKKTTGDEKHYIHVGRLQSPQIFKENIKKSLTIFNM